ncbi:MAG: thermonuclease family protein [Candidatus Aenigmatarchaeota archaeon]
MKKLFYFLPTFLLLAFSFLQHNFSEIEEGVVSKVIDGDTFELKSGERVRLIGIDAPEQGEFLYEEARDFLKEMVEGKRVKMERESQNKDKYGRFLRYVFVEGKLVNCELLKKGFAKSIAKTKYECFEQAEKEAREKKIGIWSS